MSIQITGDASSYDKAIDEMLAATAKAVDAIGVFEANMQKLNFDKAEEEIKGFAGVVATSKKELSSITGEYGKITAKTKVVADNLDTYTTRFREANKNIKTAVKNSASGFNSVSTKLETATKNVKSFSASVRGVNTRINTLSTRLDTAKKSAKSFATGLNNALKKNDIAKSLSNLTATIDRFTAEIRKSVEGLASFNKAKNMLNMTKSMDSLGKLEKTLKHTNSQIKIMGVNMTAILHMAFYRIFVRLTQYIRQSIRTVLEFNRALIEIQSVASGDFNLGVLEEQIRSLASSAGLVKKDITEALYQILSLQYADATSAMGELNAMISASITLNTKLTDVVEVTAMAFNNYGTAVGTTDNIMAIFNRTIQLGKVRLAEMTNIMGQVLPIAGNLGVGLEEVSAMMDTFTIKGMSAAKAGTQIRGLFLSLIKPTKALSDAYERLGFTSGKQGIQLFGLSGFLKKINNEFKGNIGLISRAIGRQRALNAFISLSKNNFAELDNAIDETNNSLDDYLKVKKDPVDSMANRFESAMQRMKNAFEKEFTQPFIKAMISLNETFGPLIGSAMKLMKYLVLIGSITYAWIKFSKVLNIISIKYGHLLKLTDTMYKLRKQLASVRAAEVVQTEVFMTKSVNANNKIMRSVGILRAKMITSIESVKAVSLAAITTVWNAIKAVAVQTVIVAALYALIYVIEKVIAVYADAQMTIEKANAKIRTSIQSVAEKISATIELNKGLARTEESKVVAKYDKIRQSAQELYVWSLKGSLSLEQFIKRTDSVIKEANKKLANYFHATIKASDDTVKKLTKDIETISRKIKTEAITIKDTLNNFFGKITYEIDIITGKRSLEKTKKEISELQKDIIKVTKDANDRIRQERSKTTVSTARIKDIKSDLSDKVQGYNEQIKTLQETISKSNLFYNKKIPSLYQGLNLEETKKYLGDIKTELEDTFKTILAGKNVKDTTNEGLEKQKQLITDLTVLKQKLAMAGLDTKNIDTTIANNKKAYRNMLKEAKNAKDKLLAIEKAKNEELKKYQEQYDKAYKNKDLTALKELRDKAVLPKEIKEQVNVVISTIEAQDQAQHNWEVLQNINRLQLDELKAIREELVTKNEKQLAKKEQATALGEAKIAINLASQKFNESASAGTMTEAGIRNTTLVSGAKAGAAERIIKEMLQGGNAGMIRPLTESTEMMKEAMDVLKYERESAKTIGDKQAIDAINMLSKALTEVYKANKKVGDVVETPTTFKQKKEAKGKETVDLTIKDQRQSEIKINLDGQVLAKQLVKVFNDMPELQLST